MFFSAKFGYTAKSCLISSKDLPAVSLVLAATIIAPRRKGTARIEQTIAVGSTVKSMELAAVAITADTLKNAQTPITELLIDAGVDSLIIRVVSVRILE